MTEEQLISQFQKIDDDLNEAYENNNVEKLTGLLSSSWTMLEPGIGIVSKADFINTIKDGRLIHATMNKKVLHVKAFDNMAIVISRGRNIGQYLSKPFNIELWVTNIYKLEDKGWICISTQEAPVPCLDIGHESQRKQS